MNKLGNTSICSLVAAALLFCIAAAAEIDSGFLTGHPFKYGTVISSGEAVFKGDGTYTFSYESEGIYWYNSGSYSIKKEGVVLAPDFCSTHRQGEAVNCADTMGAAVCTVKEEPNDMFFSKYFVCTSQKNMNAVSTGVPSMAFPIETCRVKAGTGRIFRGMPVVTMGMAKGTTTSGVKIREKPSVNAKALEYNAELFAPDKTAQSVPANTEVVIIARTRDKDKVQSWNNYWYLVNVGVTSNVWMYGEFVKIK
jgi:hypothetical protein